MGNTGEGEEGTKGKFDVHLHFGIYIRDENREETVNPYPFLRDIDEK
jgi:murein DD-endopeptidase MepM/ murein hydrolase activator NlpD